MPNRPSHVAHYRILDKIGEGGMGEVYRGVDTRLDREVAIKALPEALSRDPERLARLEREAKLLATVNHASIAAVHGLETHDGSSYLVMELIPGEDLAERLSRGSIPVLEALPLALQIAEALEAAHERGIVHRDLKPGNVKLTPDGGVKLLDFGLAKVVEGDVSSPDLSRSPTITGAMTAADVLLGTAAYMAPEQARGGPVDRRADIWAFGAVLFEMLTGRKAFTGDTVSDTLAAVLRAEPPWPVLPRDTPPRVRELLERCLERDPRRRLRDVGEARIALERTLAGDDGGRAPARRGGGALPWLGAGIALGAAAAFILAREAVGPAADPAVRKLDVVPAPGDPGPPVDPAISPDGRRVAYVSHGALWVRELDGLQPRRLEGPEDPAIPFWSPNGAHLGFLSGRRIQRIPAAGGMVALVCDMGAPPKGGPGGGAGAVWTPGERIVFTRGDGDLFEVPAGGGDPRVLAAADTTVEQDMHEPSFVDDGGFLVVRHRRGLDADTIVYLAPGGERHVLLTVEDQRLRRPVYDAAAGALLYSRQSGNAGVWAVPFSPKEARLTGEPFLVVPGGRDPAVAAGGTLVCERGSEAPLLRLVETDAAGNEIRALGEPAGFSFRPSLSPDGDRIAVCLGDEETNDVWIHDIRRDLRRRLTFTPGVELEPVWSPAGARVAYYAAATFGDFGIVWEPADGEGTPDTLVAGAATPAFSPDGRYLVHARYDPASEDWDLWCLEIGTGAAFPVVTGRGWQYGGAVSPDGEYLAYISRETGRDEIYLTRFPASEGKWQVSPDGGLWPHWSAAGDRLFYAAGDAVMEVGVDPAGGAPRLGRAELRFRRDRVSQPPPNGWSPGFAVNGDGSRFYLLRDVEGGARRASLLVVQNWAAEFGGRR